jgi:hypothetical protein
LKEQGNEPPQIKEYGKLNRILEFIFQRPFRPQNLAALYQRPIYSTASPVVKCEIDAFQDNQDNSVSSIDLASE